MKFDRKAIKPVSFKKRFYNGYCFDILQYGNIGLKITKSYDLEYIYMFELRKKLKFFLTLRKKILNKKLWVNLIGNYPISKKSKNSRMGKGKGAFLRLSCRLKKNTIFMEFLNLNFIILKKIIYIYNKKNNMNLKLVKTEEIDIFFKKKNISYYNIYQQY